MLLSCPSAGKQNLPAPIAKLPRKPSRGFINKKNTQPKLPVIIICYLPCALGLLRAVQNAEEEIFLPGKQPSPLKSKWILLPTSEEPDPHSVSSQPASRRARSFRHFEGVRLLPGQVFFSVGSNLNRSQLCRRLFSGKKRGRSFHARWVAPGKGLRGRSGVRRGAGGTEDGGDAEVQAGWGGTGR